MLRKSWLNFIFIHAMFLISIAFWKKRANEGYGQRGHVTPSHKMALAGWNAPRKYKAKDWDADNGRGGGRAWCNALMYVRGVNDRDTGTGQRRRLNTGVPACVDLLGAVTLSAT